MTMRLLFMILMFAIGFSGYSAAAHAFAKDNCIPAPFSKSIESDVGSSDCHGHQGDADTKKDIQPDDKTSKAKCFDCTHCCATHAANTPQNHVMVFPSLLKVGLSLAEDGEARGNLLSLLRPPRILV